MAVVNLYPQPIFPFGNYFTPERQSNSAAQIQMIASGNLPRRGVRRGREPATCDLPERGNHKRFRATVLSPALHSYNAALNRASRAFHNKDAWGAFIICQGLIDGDCEDPNTRAAALMIKAWCQHRLGMDQFAITTFDTLLAKKIAPHPRHLAEAGKGWAFLKLGNYQKALEIFNGVLSDTPAPERHPRALISSGKVYALHKLGRNREAEEFYNTMQQPLRLSSHS